MAELLLVTVSAGTLEMVALTEKLPASFATMGKPRLVLAPAAILARLQVMACAVLAVPDAMLQPAGRLEFLQDKPPQAAMRGEAWDVVADGAHAPSQGKPRAGPRALRGYPIFKPRRRYFQPR